MCKSAARSIRIRANGYIGLFATARTTTLYQNYSCARSRLLIPYQTARSSKTSILLDLYPSSRCGGSSNAAGIRIVTCLSHNAYTHRSYLLLANSRPVPHSISTSFSRQSPSFLQSSSAFTISSNISSTTSPFPPSSLLLIWECFSRHP